MQSRRFFWLGGPGLPDISTSTLGLGARDVRLPPQGASSSGQKLGNACHTRWLSLQQLLGGLLVIP